MIPRNRQLPTRIEWDCGCGVFVETEKVVNDKQLAKEACENCCPGGLGGERVFLLINGTETVTEWLMKCGSHGGTKEKIKEESWDYKEEVLLDIECD